MPGFPYMSYKLTSLLFAIGLFLATLNLFLAAGGISIALTSLIKFIGVFLTGWALISYAVTKQLLPFQRLVAAFFAALIVTGIFGIVVSFKLIIP